MPRIVFALLLLASTLRAQDWPQWGRTSQHDGAAAVTVNGLDRIEATIVIDPLVEDEKAADDDELIVHYPVPLVDGDDLFLLEKGGVFVGHDVPQTQTWSVKNVRRTASGYATRWMFTSDWMPPPTAQRLMITSEGSAQSSSVGHFGPSMPT